MNFYKKIIFFFFCFFPAFLWSHKYDYELSKKLTEDYIRLLKNNDTGIDFYKKYKKIKKNFPGVFLRYSKDSGLAWYDKEKDRIFLNTKYVMIFFDIKNYSDEKIIAVLYFSSQTRRELVKYSDSVYFHELVHSFQDFKYGDSRYFKEGLFLELEYEAYLLSDMYFFDKIKKEKNLFVEFLKGEYSDVYFSEYAWGLLSVSWDMDEYKKNINMRYLNEVKGYVSLTEEEIKRKYALEEKKIISYAVGDRLGVKREAGDFEKLKKQKEEYSKFLEDYYKNIWPDFSYKVLRFLIDASYKAKNYFVFFNSAYHFKKNSKVFGYQKDKEIEEKEALFYLDFLNFLKDRDKKDFELVAAEISAFEKFCDLSFRDIPDWVIKIRDENYKKTYAKYLKIVQNEKDEVKKNYYIENMSYFCSKVKDLSCDNLIK